MALSVAARPDCYRLENGLRVVLAPDPSRPAWASLCTTTPVSVQSHRRTRAWRGIRPGVLVHRADATQANIRDDLGYAYRVYSSIEHARAGSRLIIEVDVASRLVAETLAELRRELVSLTAERPGEEELRQARDFSMGGLALETGSQVDVAMLLFRLVPFDLDLAWVDGHFSALADVGPAELAEVAEEFLAPERFVTAVVADAAATGDVPGLRPIHE
jgi:hypothetical protein